MVHGQGVHLDGADAALQLPQEAAVHPFVHIAEYDIRPGGFARRHHFHGKLRTSDPSSNQGRVEHQSLHKAILGAPKGLVLRRLVHAPHGIGAAVQADAGVVAVDEQAGDAGQQAFQDLIQILHGRDLHIGHHTAHHLPGGQRQLLGLQLVEKFQQLLHDGFLQKAVDKINAGVPPACHNAFPNDIKIVIQIQDSIQTGRIFL